MKLPNDEIGISDILDYRECPQRFAYGMRRHQEMPERFRLEPGEKAEPPQAQSWATAYGSCVHDAIEIIEKTQCSNDEALDQVWIKYQHYLRPADIDDMRRDLDVYRTRSATGYRLVDTELELRMPLFMHEGRWIYFRGRIDVLLQHIDNPGIFLGRDYKSSRTPKSRAEIEEDIQQWAYNLLIHETFPECDTLIQSYDQLKFGETPIRKSAHQRAQIKAWLIKQVKAILTDEVFKPTSNDFCQFCPLMMDCRVTHMSTEFWVNRLGVLAPERKEGRKIVVELTDDHAGFEVYLDILPKAKKAQKVLERFVGAVEQVIRDMDDEQRAETGYRFGKTPEMTKFGPEEIKRVQAMLGDEFPYIASISKTAVEEFFGKDSAQAKAVIEVARTDWGTPRLLPPKAEAGD